MRLFGWVQNKLSAKPVNKKPTTVYAATNQICAKQEAREEFSDWPHGLLAIGTFGKSTSSNENPSFSSISEEEEIVDFSPEEVGKLQKELTKLLSRKPNKEKEIADLPLDRFLNCPSSLEVDRRIYNFSEKLELDLKTDHHEDNIEKTISVIIDKCKHICAHNNNKKAIGKKSISFLLKKMFVCTSGFAPTPSFRDTLLQQSRMEKILKMMLQKNMNAQNYSPPASSTAKKYLEDIKQMPKRKNNEDDDNEKRGGNDNDGCKWVNTDSEYIVLEI